MSDTVLDHVLVRQYLRELDAACAGLPGPQARELHEQLAAHLDEALPGDATNEAVRWELGRLGTPQVRVGVVTRTETVIPVEAFALAGPSQGKCN